MGLKSPMAALVGGYNPRLEISVPFWGLMRKAFWTRAPATNLGLSMFHRASESLNERPFCEVLIPVLGNSVAIPVVLSIRTKVSVTPGPNSSYQPAMFPKESKVLEWMGEPAVPGSMDRPKVT